MHRDVRGHFCIFLIAIGMLFAGSGCSFVKVPQGWVLNTGWSLEFHRMPFNVSCDRPCGRSCELACEPDCSPDCKPDCANPPPSDCDNRSPEDCANPPKDSAQPAPAPEPAEPTPAPTLHKVEGEMPEPPASAGLWNLLKRRGRLGVCATCGKLGHMNDKEPQPAIESTAPVIAKFHPVPAAPVFCPQPNAIQATKPVDYQTPAGKQKPSPNKKSAHPQQPGKIPPPRLQPEEIPSPPPTPQINKLNQAPRELDVPPEPPDWVFTVPENQSEKMSEAKAQSSKSSGPVRR